MCALGHTLTWSFGIWSCNIRNFIFFWTGSFGKHLVNTLLTSVFVYRSDIVEHILCSSLFPSEFSIKDKVKKWVRVFLSFDKVEIRALEKLLEHKQRFVMNVWSGCQVFLDVVSVSIYLTFVVQSELHIHWVLDCAAGCSKRWGGIFL